MSTDDQQPPAMVIHCFACGERKRLRGSRRQIGPRTVVTLRCESCGHEWERRPEMCDACGGDRVTLVRVPLIQKARGAQQSITGYRSVRECLTCGAQSGSTKPPENYTRDDA